MINNTPPREDTAMHMVSSELSGAMLRTIDRCRARLGLPTRVAVIRKAIVTLDDLLEVMAEDGVVRILRKDGTTEVWRVRN